MIKRILQFFLLLSICVSAHSQATGLSDLKFGRYQIADSQWNVSACLYTSTCQIYSKNPGTAYKIPWYNGQLSWATGDYVAFTATGDATNPWNAVQYNANGTVKAVMGTGHIINMGSDFFFFVGNDNNTGQLFSMTSGMNSTAGLTWTGTLNPTVSQVNTLAANGSTTPLDSGATYTPVPAGPTIEGGTITQTNAPTNQIITSGGGSAAGYTGTQQTRVETWTNSVQSYNNELYIEQTYGENNTINVTQSGVKNRIDFTLDGNGNSVNLTQEGSNYLRAQVPGWGNNVTVNQSNSVTTNYAETKIQGNGNTVNHLQTGNANQVLFSTVTGDINTVNTTQTGTAGHYAETKLTGNWNNVKVDQSGSAQNKANIDVTNAGGPATVDLQQTGGKNFTIIQTCVNPAGCSTTVRQ